MSVFEAVPHYAFISPSIERMDAAAMAARCGDDVVRLRPMWAAIIAATRFAREARWMFGNRAAALECHEPQPKRWLTHRGATDPVQVRFDFAQWHSAYARCDGRAREINVFAADGSAIVAVRLDDVDSTLDELLWLLVDDDQTAAPEPPQAAPAAHSYDHARLRDSLRVLERRSDFDRLVARSGVTRRHAFRLAGRDVARPLAWNAVHLAVRAAFNATLPLRLLLENAGGRVEWSPHAATLRETAGVLDVRSALGSVRFSACQSGVWAVRLAGVDSADQTLEAYGGDDRSWLTLALGDATHAQRDTWRTMCATLLDRVKLITS